MARRIEESDPLLHRATRPRDIQPSLPSPIPELEGPRFLLKQLSCLPCNICIKSKAAILILVWSIMVGGFYLGLLISFWGAGLAWQNYNYQHYEHLKVNVVIYTLVAAYAFLALLLLLYPLSGYLADIYCGRYKAVTLSVVFLWVAMVLLSVAAVMGIVKKFDKFGDLKIPFGLLVSIGLVLVVIGLAGYQANIVQLGLDQLLEAPSEKLGLFVHWLMWAYNLGGIFMMILFVSLPCYITVEAINEKFIHTLGSSPFISLAVLSFLLAFTCYNHSWFYSEPGQHNPYKTVFRVLNFARKNKYPLRRSAFTFCDDFRPSRIDFAKERFGGPFTTSQVEDVKTFFRIVVVLLALGPVFVLEIPGSYYLFPLFALHVSDKLQFRDNKPCRSPVDWALLQSGGLGCIVTMLFLPIYIWVIFSLLRKQVPRILNRLWCGMVMSLAGVLCLLIIDLVGHFHYHHHDHSASGNSHHLNSTCLFTSNYLYIKDKDHQLPMPVVLKVHKGAIIAPIIMLNLSYSLIQATTFEFISAQSPHSMKGLLVGVFFAIKGLFQSISAAAVVPFAIPNIWNKINPVTNCAFGYYLLNIIVALSGLVIFTVVIRRYRYRQRDERPYDPRYVEQYYERYIGVPSQDSNTGVYTSSDEHMYHEELGHTCSDSSSDVSSINRGNYSCISEVTDKDKRRFHR